MSNLEIFSNQDFVKIFTSTNAHLVDFTLFDTIDAFRYNLKYRSIQFSKQFLYNMAHLLSLNVFTASKGSNNYILFAITAAGVVQCVGPKKSPRTSSIVQIIFFF